MNTRIVRLVCFTLIPAFLRLSPGVAAAPATNDDVLARSAAMYASLKSYADTGTVEETFGPKNALGHEKHTFKTLYRGPRHVFFDFVKSHNADRFVVWSDDNTLHIWWKTTQKVETYPKGKWQVPLLIGGPQTKGSLLQLMPYFLREDKLVGTLTELGPTTLAGKEMLDKRQCYKLTGTAKSVYGATGHQVNIRPVTVWIDAETLLVRKVVEEAAQGSAPGWVQRTTTTFEPQANPNLADTQFQFSPPSSGKNR
ncbi:MAG TPA: hypothetical protein VEW69_05655 [Alphaproteobacteria bacterium]|nr:hypothetical protein [Alphaproteobacteria bacterium]